MVDHSRARDDRSEGTRGRRRGEALFSDDGKRVDAFGKYALPGNRYKKLIAGNFMRMELEALEEFGHSLAADSMEISTDELNELFEGDWRERLTASWLVGMDKREDFRQLVSALLLERSEPYAGKGYCFTLLRLGSLADAQTLFAYLERNLRDLEDRADQPWALGALLVIENELNLDLSSVLLDENGLWMRWAAAGRQPGFAADEMRQVMQTWGEFGRLYSSK